ncbi:sirohydrochlorin chelatase [Streptomyces sp. NPDC005438]|uniref:sirohydrochlorin chelatase n=1 Tax=Streptomyces sp. NPDC005438 TaxID=3156880 RepID=UPI0033A5A0E9
MNRPTLLLIAHGSRDPRHAATAWSLREQLRARPDAPRVELGFLEFNAPSVPGLLERLWHEGEREVVALPWLLTHAYHSKTDIPGVLRQSCARLPGLTVTRAGVLGPHPLLVSALERRLGEAGHGHDRSGTGVVLAAAGTSDPRAAAVIGEVAEDWARSGGWYAVRPAFATGSPPYGAPEEAVTALRARGASRVVVAPYVLAPGRLPDRIVASARRAGADGVAEVLGAGPELVDLTLHRYTAARASRRVGTAASA